MPPMPLMPLMPPTYSCEDKRTHVSPRETNEHTSHPAKPGRHRKSQTTSISRQSISVHLSLKVSPQHVCLEAYQTILLPLSPDYLGRGGRNRREGGTVRREGRGRTDRMPEPRSSTTAEPNLSMQHEHDPAAQMQPKGSMSAPSSDTPADLPGVAL